MVALAGDAYSSEVTITETADDPDALAVSWLEGRQTVPFNEDDAAYTVRSAGLASGRAMSCASEGAIEWYAENAPALGRSANAVGLPGVSRMYLPSLLPGGFGYVLAFHPENTDCATKGTLLAAGGGGSSTVLAGGVGQYSSGSPATLRFAARAGVDGSLEFVLRNTGPGSQEVRWYERAGSSVKQNVLLMSLPAGQTARLQFSPSPNYQPYVPASVKSMEGRFSLAAGAVTPFAMRAVTGARVMLDTEFGGAGRIWGTTKTKAASGNIPAKARVILLHQRSKVVARETWSDPATGAFEFASIDTRQQFLALAEDAAGNFRPVAASRLVPEVAP